MKAACPDDLIRPASFQPAVVTGRWGLLNLLDRARMLLTNLATAAPTHVQTYNVLCPEGHRLRGERTEGYQALRCPTCGEGVFSLPRSCLPDPTPPSTSARTRRAAEIAPEAVEEGPVRLTDPLPSQEIPDLEPEGEIEWMDEEGAAAADDSPPAEPPGPRPEPAPAPRPRGNAPRRSDSPVSKPAPRREAAATLTTEPAPPPVIERFSAWVRRRRNPLIFLGVFLIVAGTIGLRSWRSHRQELPRIAETALEQGLPALDEGRFDTAHQLLSAGARAVEALGGAVEGADAIRQGAREAAIYASRLSEPLEAILAEAGSQQEPAEWPSRFATVYKGRSIILRATVTAVPDADGKGGYDIDYRVFQAGEGIKPDRFGRIDLTGFKLFEEAKPKVGDEVTFGARLDSFALDTGGGLPADTRSDQWLVGLEPGSGVFMRHPKALQALGWPDPEAPEEEPQP